jgi:hypothetical protein
VLADPPCLGFSVVDLSCGTGACLATKQSTSAALSDQDRHVVSNPGKRLMNHAQDSLLEQFASCEIHDLGSAYTLELTLYSPR